MGKITPPEPGFWNICRNTTNSASSAVLLDLLFTLDSLELQQQQNTLLSVMWTHITVLQPEQLIQHLSRFMEALNQIGQDRQDDILVLNGFVQKFAALCKKRYVGFPEPRPSGRARERLGCPRATCSPCSRMDTFLRSPSQGEEPLMMHVHPTEASHCSNRIAGRSKLATGVRFRKENIDRKVVEVKLSKVFK